MHEKAKKKNEKSNCTKEWIYGMVTIVVQRLIHITGFREEKAAKTFLFLYVRTQVN